MSLPTPFRFAVEAALLVAVGVALAAADLELVPFVVVMGIAWALIATGERMLSRPRAASSVWVRARHRDESLPVHQVREPAPETPRPEPEPVRAEEREPELEAEHEPEPVRVLEPVPEPTPEPEPEEPDEAVAELPQAAHRRPDGWNLWDLERRAQQLAGDDPFRDEEWNALFVSLREFAEPDGTLPPEFDALVQESFGALISRRA